MGNNLHKIRVACIDDSKVMSAGNVAITIDGQPLHGVRDIVFKAGINELATVTITMYGIVEITGLPGDIEVFKVPT